VKGQKDNGRFQPHETNEKKMRSGKSGKTSIMNKCQRALVTDRKRTNKQQTKEKKREKEKERKNQSPRKDGKKRKNGPVRMFLRNPKKNIGEQGRGGEKPPRRNGGHRKKFKKGGNGTMKGIPKNEPQEEFKGKNHPEKSVASSQSKKKKS